MNVDTALLQRESGGNPIRVGMVGAGATGRAIALQLGTPVPGMRLVAIANRTLEHGERAFREAGFQWRESGCSMCIAMNGDQLAEGERCASTSNRNFEGRQGRGGRTHLVSPAMAAAAAIAGHFVDIREM